MSEQELHSWLEDYFLNISPDRKCDTIAIDIVAKLKAIGYEQVWEICPDCEGKGYKTTLSNLPPANCLTCKGTGRKRKLVKWDREKVAIHYCADREIDYYTPEGNRLGNYLACQLHKILGGE